MTITVAIAPGTGGAAIAEGTACTLAATASPTSRSDAVDAGVVTFPGTSPRPSSDDFRIDGLPLSGKVPIRRTMTRAEGVAVVVAADMVLDPSESCILRFDPACATFGWGTAATDFGIVLTDMTQPQTGTVAADTSRGMDLGEGCNGRGGDDGLPRGGGGGWAYVHGLGSGAMAG